jgi:hypothetical protein
MCGAKSKRSRKRDEAERAWPVIHGLAKNEANHPTLVGPQICEREKAIREKLPAVKK